MALNYSLGESFFWGQTYSDFESESKNEIPLSCQCGQSKAIVRLQNLKKALVLKTFINNSYFKPLKAHELHQGACYSQDHIFLNSDAVFVILRLCTPLWWILNQAIKM